MIRIMDLISQEDAAQLAHAHKDRFRIVPYPELRDRATHLAEQLVRSGITSEDVVVPVLMGGALPARLVLDAMTMHGISPDVAPLRIVRYEGVGRAHEPRVDLGIEGSRVAGKRIVAVDDLVDGGQTLAFAEQYVLNLGAESFAAAVCYQKPTSRYNPKFVAERDVLPWLVLPGEEYDFMTEISTADEMLREQPEAIVRAYFRGLGLSRAIVSAWTSAPHR